jgi:tetratricopeptide (TPR) repeat protein
MKWICLNLITICLIQTAFAQQPAKVDEALLLEYYQNQRFADAADYLKKTYPEPVTDTKILTQLAYTSQMAGKLADAEGYYLRIFNADSSNTTVLFNLGAINIRRGNNLKAEGFYKKIAQRDTTNFMVYKQLATISQVKGDLTNQLHYLEKANRLNPAEPDVASDLSDQYVLLKKFTEADSVLSKAIAADPENSVLLLSRLKLLYSQGKWENAKNTAIQLKQLGDESGYVLTKLGIAYYNLKDYVCAIETLADISDMEQSETSFYIAALAYKALKRQTEATDYLARAINAGISPNIADYYSEMADSFEILKNYRMAVFAYEKGLQFQERPITYYLLANLYDTELKNKKMARLFYKKYIASDPPKKESKYLAYAQSRINALALH